MTKIKRGPWLDLRMLTPVKLTPERLMPVRLTLERLRYERQRRRVMDDPSTCQSPL